jgi:hypothetical protein
MSNTAALGAPFSATSATVACGAMDEPQLNDDGTKTCTQCAERVQGAALVCRFCGHRFDGKPAPVAPGETSTSGVAVAAFICALLDLWIAAIPLGIHARRQIDQSGGRKTGRGFATAGIILGVVGMIASVIVTLAVVGAFTGSPEQTKAQTPAQPGKPYERIGVREATEGTKALWRPSDPEEAPSQAVESEVRSLIEREEEKEGGTPSYSETLRGDAALVQLLKLGQHFSGEQALEHRTCVLAAIYGEEATTNGKENPSEVKALWLAIALLHHEAAAEEAAKSAAASCPQPEK